MILFHHNISKKSKKDIFDKSDQIVDLFPENTDIGEYQKIDRHGLNKYLTFKRYTESNIIQFNEKDLLMGELMIDKSYVMECVKYFIKKGFNNQKMFTLIINFNLGLDLYYDIRPFIIKHQNIFNRRELVKQISDEILDKCLTMKNIVCACHNCHHKINPYLHYISEACYRIYNNNDLDNIETLIDELKKKIQFNKLIDMNTPYKYLKDNEDPGIELVRSIVSEESAQIRGPYSVLGPCGPEGTLIVKSIKHVHHQGLLSQTYQIQE